MSLFRLRSTSLFLIAGLSLSGCSTYGLGYGGGYGTSGVSIGYGSGYGGYYGSPYYGYYGSPYYGRGLGWYDGFYYPGSGSYIYNRYGSRYSWNDHHRNYWQRGGHGASGSGGYVGLPHGLGSSHVGVTSSHRRSHSGLGSGSHRSSAGHRSTGHSSGHHGH